MLLAAASTSSDKIIKCSVKALPFDTAKSLVNCFVISRIDYCNSLLSGVPQYALVRLQRVMNAAARMLYGAGKYSRDSRCVALTACACSGQCLNIEPERGGAALRKFFGSRSGAPELLGRSKAERRAFWLLGYVSLISLCLDEYCEITLYSFVFSFLWR